MSPTPSTPPPLPITWVSRVHTSWYDTLTQQSYEGYNMKFVWNPTGSLLELKVPDASYTTDGVYRQILALGNQDNAIHGLAAQPG